MLPTELSTHLWDLLRPASISLRSGITVIPTNRGEIAWPQVVSDVSPEWTEEGAGITASDPGPPDCACGQRNRGDILDRSSLGHVIATHKGDWGCR